MQEESHNTNRRLRNVFFNTHTVSGIIISVGLYVIFLAGAFALFQNTINNWEISELEKEISPRLNYDDILDKVAAKGYQMYRRDINFSLVENNGSYLSVFSPSLVNKISTDSLNNLGGQDSVRYSEAIADFTFVFDADNGQLLAPDEGNGAQERIGRLLTKLHYFQQIPVIGIFLSGFVSLFFLFGIVSGIIIHWKKIVSNFFTFRLKSSIKNLWADAHTALGVLGIPFQLMYALTGTTFGLGVVIFPIAYVVLDEPDKIVDIFLPERKSYELIGQSDNQVPVTPIVEDLLRELPEEEIRSFRVMVKNYGDQNAHLTTVFYTNTKEDFSGKATATHKLSNGSLVSKESHKESSFRTASAEYFLQLHFGNFGGNPVRIIYFLLALLTCFVIITGVMVWLTAREKKTYANKAKFNQNVGAIYLGACLGLYPAIAILFIIAKVLPLDMDGRYRLINYTFFGFWLAYTTYASLIKSNFKINKHALLLAGTLGLGIPVANGLVTGLWFWTSYGQGYVDSFFVDVSWLMLGGISLWAAFVVKPTHQRREVTKNEMRSAERYYKPQVKPYEPALTINQTQE
ncbi:MAG: PepSY-associated TM helix domain-containing protein [Bacteroidota bacterium]